MNSDPNLIPISSRDDPRVDVYRNVQDRDLLGRHGLFIAEGELVVSRLIRSSPFKTRSILLNPTRLKSMAPTLAALPRETPVYVAEQDVFDEIAGFHIHRGVLAAGERPVNRPIPDLVAPAPPDAVVLFLEDVSNHDNIGGVFRCAAAFGAAGVVLSERCVDPLYRKAIRVSIGATLTVPFARATTTDALAALAEAGFVTVALTPDSAAAEIAQWAGEGKPRRIAFLLGAEGPGLSRKAFEAADHRVRIGSMVGADSLNVAVASGIALHALQSRR